MREWMIPAFGVALSPLPILGMLLFLGGRRPMLHGAAFWLAWTVGVAAPTTAFLLVADRSNALDDEHAAIAVAEIAIGVLFLAVVVRLAFGPRPANSDASVRWLEALDRAGPLRAGALGLLLSAGNPKNLALMLAAAAAIVQDGRLTTGAVSFVAVAVSTISLLLLGYAAFAERARPTLTRLRGSIARNDRRLAIVIGILVGAFFVFDGVRSL